MDHSVPMDELQQALLVLMQRASRILVFTGAGVSTGSGIPDFRGPDGVWKRRRPVYYNEFMSSEAARIEHWDFKLEGWPAFKAAEPNPAHRAIARLEQAGLLEMVVTQNIDGLHSKAGTSPARLVELHGTNLRVECQTCGELSSPDASFEAFRRTRKPPTCHCGGLLKPATISFGQNLKEREIERACQAAESADLVLALGSTLSVHPAAEIPLIGARAGAPYVVINRGSTEHDRLSGLTLRLEGDVTALFPPVVNQLLEGRQTV
jgi:NAD-dependent deacetylase